MPLPQVIPAGLPSLIGNTLRDRFYKQQFEFYMQNEYASYQSEVQNLSAALADPSDPDMGSKILQSYKAATDKMMTSATRYSNNPYIADLAQKHFQHDMGQFGQIVELAKAGMAAQPGAGESEKQAAEVEHLKAQTGKEKALTRKYRAEAGAKAAPQITNFFDNWDTSSVPSMTNALKRFDAEPLVKRRQTEKEAIRLQLAGERLGELVKAKVVNPATGRLYSGGSKEVEQILTTGAVTPEMVDEAWEMRTLKGDLKAKFGLSDEDIETTFPQYEWPGKEPTGVTIGRANLNVDQAVETLLSSVGYQNLSGNQDPNVSRFNTVKQAAEQLPNDVTALKDGPMQHLFYSVMNIQGYNPDTQSPFENYKEYEKWMRSRANQIVNSTIGGYNIPDSLLDNETRASRQKARAFATLMIDKYAPHVARETGIEGAPKSKLSEEFTPLGFGRTTVAGRVESGIRAVGKLFEPIEEVPTQPGERGPALIDKKAPSAPPKVEQLDIKPVKVQTIPKKNQDRYFRVQQNWVGSPGSDEWDMVGPNASGDLIIRNMKTGKTTLVKWSGSEGSVTGLKAKK